MPEPRISLVIPAYNEEKFLPRLLQSVEAARLNYESTGCAMEVIVADNASTDGTARVAAERGCRVVPVQKRCIAAARNGGARVARGQFLAFVDADFQIHPQTFLAIEEALASEKVIAGASGATLERWSAGIAVSFALLVPFVWMTGFDTGVVFCRRADFEAVGGYDERRRIAEDVTLLLALRRLGKRRGQRLVRVTRIKAIASTRKFDEFGEWHYLKFMGLAAAYLLGLTKFEDAIERYWYRVRR